MALMLVLNLCLYSTDVSTGYLAVPATFLVRITQPSFDYFHICVFPSTPSKLALGYLSNIGAIYFGKKSFERSKRGQANRAHHQMILCTWIIGLAGIIGLCWIIVAG